MSLTLDNWERLELKEIRTGDVLFFTNNSTTGLTLKTFTSTLWTHTGIAVRLKYSYQLQRYRVTVDDTGELYVMEINSKSRYDAYFGYSKKGFGFTNIDLVLKTQVIMAIRQMKSKYRVPDLIEYTERFADKYEKASYIGDITPLLNVWIGYPFSGVGMRSSSRTQIEESSNIYPEVELFCSEMMTYYYISILPVIIMIDNYASIEKETFLSTIERILGEGSPQVPELISPRYYDPMYSPKAPFFEDSIKLVHRRLDRTSKVLTMPVIMTLGIAAGIYACLKLSESSPDCEER